MDSHMPVTSNERFACMPIMHTYVCRRCGEFSSQPRKHCPKCGN